GRRQRREAMDRICGAWPGCSAPWGCRDARLARATPDATSAATTRTKPLPKCGGDVRNPYQNAGATYETPTKMGQESRPSLVRSRSDLALQSTSNVAPLDVSTCGEILPYVQCTVWTCDGA